MIDHLTTHDIAIPREGRFYHPLAAVYRLTVEQAVRDLIAAERMRPFYLLEQCDAGEIDVVELRAVDPELDSLKNSNTPEDYRAVLELRGKS